MAKKKKTRFKEYFYAIDDIMSSKTRRRMNKKSHKGRYYGGAGGMEGGGGESIADPRPVLAEMRGGSIPHTFSDNALGSMRAQQGLEQWRNKYKNRNEEGYEEELETTARKIDLARGIFNAMINNPNVTRMDIINAMMDRAGVTESTAVSYYERIAKEAGLTNQGDRDPQAGVQPGMGGGVGMGQGSGGAGGQQAFQQMPPETDMEDELNTEIEHSFPDDPNRQGIIRYVDKAHLVYKRQTPDGTFEELWIYNISKEMKDELVIRKKILAGTDIPPSRTRSEDGSQSYTMTTLGNAQYVHITGLPN